MRRGDIVRLKQPLQIPSGDPEEFSHGIIAARIKHDSELSDQQRPGSQPPVKDLIVYLYNPDTSKICLDEVGVPVLFDFQLSEVELYKAVKQNPWIEEKLDRGQSA